MSAITPVLNFIPSVSALSDVVTIQNGTGAVAGNNATKNAGFSTLFERAVADVNQQMLSSETGLQNLASGHATNIHDVMIGIEQAKLQFQLFMQIRNRALESYQELMRTQV